MSDLMPSDGPRHPRAGGAPPAAPPDPRFADDTIDLRDILAVLRRHRMLVLLCTLGALALAVLLILRDVPEYRAESVIRLKDERRALTGALQGDPLGEMMGKSTDPILSQLEVLRSRTVAEEVVARTGLRFRSLTEGFAPSALMGANVADPAVRDTLVFEFGRSGYTVASQRSQQPVEAVYGEPVALGSVGFVVPEPPEVEEAEVVVTNRAPAVKLLRERMSASPIEGTDVIRVGFVSTDPRRAQHVVNTTVEVFQEVNATEAQQQSRRRRVFLEEQLQRADSTLAIAQAELSEFRRREEVFSSRERFAAQQQGILQLEVQREELEAQRRVYQSLLDALHEGDETERGLRALISAPGLAENPVVEQLYTQLVRYRASRDSLTIGRGNPESNPDVVAMNTMIANTQRDLVEAANSYLTALDARRRSLDELIQRNTAQIQLSPDVEAEEMRLVQRLETVQMMADQLRQEFQRASIAEAVEVGQVEVVDAAILPTEPIGSGKALKLALALMLGVMTGTGAAFVREHLDNRITRTDELESLLGLAPLAVIPKVAETNGRGGPQRRLPVAGGNGSIQTPGEQLVLVSDATSAGAEAYRSLRTNLIFSQANGKLRSIAVTSPAPAEGKSTTAANLAVAFAQQGLSVVLIDADLRRAQLHRIYDFVREPGLSDVLAGQVALEDALRTNARGGVSLLTAGSMPPNPSELLGSAQMRDLLARLSTDHDLVIIDVPPVLAAGDASIVGALVDGTVLVVRAGRTEREPAQAAVRQLRGVGARIIGAVLNDPDGRMARYGGYYYYGYSDS